MEKKIINGIEITDETFVLVTEEEFDNTLKLISEEKHEDYSGYVEVESWDSSCHFLSSGEQVLTTSIGW